MKNYESKILLTLLKEMEISLFYAKKDINKMKNTIKYDDLKKNFRSK